MEILKIWDMVYLYTIAAKYKDLRSDLYISREERVGWGGGVLNDEFFIACLTENDIQMESIGLEQRMLRTNYQLASWFPYS
jgi:hypothetical protein